MRDRLERRLGDRPSPSRRRGTHAHVGERRACQRATGSLSSKRPSSHSIIAATEVIGFVIE